ncbi:MAG TPA: alpha/beta hydrolase [Pyrinomonadaceae bacterium]|jgi:hypothetical protein
MNYGITHILRRSAALCGLVSLLAVVACGQRAEKPKTAATDAPAVVRAPKGARWRDVPEQVKRDAKYLFYLHGIIVENEGVRPTSPDYGVYEYERILDTFVERGFEVISEARPKGTDPHAYASKLVGQIKRLLDAGVPPRNITVVGASRGGGIVMFASTMLKNREVNFVILASCGDFSIYRDNKVDLWGNILSIYDFKERTGVGSCRRFVESSTGVNRHKEIVVQLGLGHGLLYRPLPEWVDPTVEWAK